MLGFQKITGMKKSDLSICSCGFQNLDGIQNLDGVSKNCWMQEMLGVSKNCCDQKIYLDVRFSKNQNPAVNWPISNGDMLDLLALRCWISKNESFNGK